MAADLLGLDRNTVNLFHRKLREVIANHSAEDAQLDGEVELDESYFGGRRKGKKGRGAAGMSIVLGFLGLPS